jgi:hypothetical protein
MPLADDSLFPIYLPFFSSCAIISDEALYYPLEMGL